MKIALISCTKSKKNYKCEAEILYSESTLFRKALYYIKENYDKWFILSAKYGLLKPTSIIEPYDLTLNKFNNEEIKTWAENVWGSLKKEINNKDKLYFHCGENYRKGLIFYLDKNKIEYEIPLRGISFGKQLQFYNKKQEKIKKAKGFFD